MSRGPLQPGDPDHIAGYALQARLGQGGQGVVFLGHDRAGRPVAVKLLHSALLQDAAARERFVRELAAVRRVARFCTAQVLDADTDGDRPYIVSEFVDGPSLHQEVERSGPRREAELDRLAIGTATALAAVHAAGVVHCDFKPGNVLLAAEGPRVIDFGIARALDVSGTTSQVIGTPAYMAPEQITRSEIRPPVDVFAWGATMAFAANAVSPFAAGSGPATMYRVLEGTPDLGRLPEPLRALVDRCLAKEPAGRPTAREVLLTLTGALEEPTADLRPRPVRDVANLTRAADPGWTAVAADDPTLTAPPTRAAPPDPTRVAPQPGPARPERPRRRGLLIGVAAALVLVVAAVTAAVLLLPRLTASAGSTVVTEAFAGEWTGTGFLPLEGTTVYPRLSLITGTSRTDLLSGESSCAGGSLVVRSVTATEMTMDFRAPGECPSGVMTFRLTAEGTMTMTLETGESYYATLNR